MSDERLTRWRDATRNALDASPDQLNERLRSLVEERIEMMRSLRESPPVGELSAELADELTAAERDLAQALGALQSGMRKRVEELRRSQEAARNYRQPASNHPAFVSKSV